MMDLLCLDVGSTFTKAVLVGPDGTVRGTAETPTTGSTDVLDGCHALAERLGAGADTTTTLACSSAGGGLRLAVVGYERQVTAEAGYRVGLSAGAKVVHVASGRLDDASVRALGRALPDLLLLVGGTDGGNADVLRHNASRLARATLGVPIVLAGNVDAQHEVAALLRDAGQPVRVADNVVPEIGLIAPASARSAIRAMFLDHVIGGKGLSSSAAFREMVRAPTPDAMLRGVDVTSEVLGTDLLVVDVGGATTDVYSVVTPDDQDASMRTDVAGTLWHARTVEGDLGVRWNAVEVVEAAARERVPVAAGLHRYATAVAADPAHLPADDEEVALDLQLATIAALVAVRRHARPSTAGQSRRPLGDVGVVLGSGGVLRHATAVQGMRVLAAVTGDHAGGWRVPRSARTGVDVAYLLFAVGLLVDEHPDIARVVATGLARSHMLGGPE
ncbi:MAG TPA: glutamate mutase L [Lapillicoccus sp.]